MTRIAEMTSEMREITIDASGGIKGRSVMGEAPASNNSTEPRSANPDKAAADIEYQRGPLDLLPLELREQIWDFAIATVPPGIYFFHEQDIQYGDAYDPEGPCLRVILPLPTILHLCRESRDHVKRKLSFTWARTKRGERLQVPCRQFNPATDAAYLSSKTVDQLYNSIHDPAETGPFNEIRHLALESRCLCNAQWPRFASLLSRLGTPNVLPNLELISVTLGRAWVRGEPPAGRRRDDKEPATPAPAPGAGRDEDPGRVAEELHGRLETVEPPLELRSRAGVWGPELIPGDPDSRRDIGEICWMFQDQMVPLQGDGGAVTERERQSRLEVGPFREVVLSAEEFRRRWPANVDFMELVVAKYC